LLLTSCLDGIRSDMKGKRCQSFTVLGHNKECERGELLDTWPGKEAIGLRKKRTSRKVVPLGIVGRPLKTKRPP